MFGYKVIGIEIDKLYPPKSNTEEPIPIEIQWSYESEIIPTNYFKRTDNYGPAINQLKITPSRDRKESWEIHFNNTIANMNIEGVVFYSPGNNYLWLKVSLTEVLDYINQVKAAVNITNKNYYKDVIDEYHQHITKEEKKHAYREQGRYINTLIQDKG